MDEEELKPKLPGWPPKSLDHMSVEALEHYGKALQAELERVRTTVQSRLKQRAAADAFFKS
jgi:uncharacterized small protein (DUF1192 family)